MEPSFLLVKRGSTKPLKMLSEDFGTYMVKSHMGSGLYLVQVLGYMTNSNSL